MFVQFTHTTPAFNRGATSSARLMFSDHTLAASPYGVLFASATASSGVRNVMDTSTGPNISSWAIVLDGATSVHSVGGRHHPSAGPPHGGCRMVAPSATTC